LLSDTHGTYSSGYVGNIEKYFEGCDVVVHSGDICGHYCSTEDMIIRRTMGINIRYPGKKYDITKQVEEFKDIWYGYARKFSDKKFVVLPGNHDFFMSDRRDDVWDYDNGHPMSSIKPGFIPDELHDRPDNLIILNNSSTTVDDVKFYGSPWTPWYGGWAYNLEKKCPKGVWNSIPLDTDVLITHGPPYRILDLNDEGKKCGDENLAKLLMSKSSGFEIKLHVFGHIHENPGIVNANGIDFINASVVDERYDMIYKPVIYEL